MNPDPWPREAEDRVNELLGQVAAKELECQRMREVLQGLADACSEVSDLTPRAYRDKVLRLGARGRMAGGWVPVDADLVLALHARLTKLAALEQQVAEGEGSTDQLGPLAEPAQEPTPGPWTLYRSDRHPEYYVNQRGGPGYVCTMPLYQHRLPECEANARLVAAAPELLAALSALVDRCTHDGVPNDSLSTWAAARDLVLRVKCGPNARLTAPDTAQRNDDERDDAARRGGSG